MADAIVSFGVEKLWELVSQECELLEGVTEQVTELKRTLNMLKSFLKDVDAQKQTSERARNFVEEIKEITYDAEDVIENFLQKEEGRNCGGIKNGMRSLACIPGGRRGIALEITSISKRISKVISDMQNFGIQPFSIDGGYSQAIEERKRAARHTFPTTFEKNLVGLEKNVDKLVREVVGNGSSQVVCITGLGGLGKTTIARHVFNHDKVKHHFDGLAWVCVSQEFTRMSVWKTILRNLSHKDSDITEEDEVQKKLVQLLETHKNLIVFDDIWKKEDWDIIKPMFPESKAWKVLLTSRNDGIDPHCVPFKPDLLSHEESWALLQMVAFPKNDTTTGCIVDKDMVEMAKELTKSCGGLPLAIKVLGGLLATRYTLREWNMISRNIKSHIAGGTSINDNDSSSVYHILSLSFEGLPVYLKHCLLQLASFPEDYKIELEKLSHYWAAEGISKPWQYDGATIRDVGDVYIDELVKRNMVISERDIATSRYETCHLHDMMREICLLKAKEENLFQIDNSSLPSHSSRKSRRLVVHCSDKYRGDNEVMNPKLRSLLFISTGWYGLRYGPRPRLCLTKLQLLRILDLSNAKFQGEKLPSGIGMLIHLRYLSLYNAKLTHLPSSLRNLKLLLYLDLHVVTITYVPNVFKQMQELRYLRLPHLVQGKTKLELGNLVKLETLENFSTKYCNLKDLLGMTKLTTLSMFLEGGCTVRDLSSLLSKLKTLENFALYDRRNVDEKDAEKFVLDCIHLNKLYLRIYMPKLPDEHQIFSHLTTISLSLCRLEEDPMRILEKLLHLTEINLFPGSFRGKRMVCSQGGFPKLIKLRILNLEDLEEWRVEEGSMPILHTLEIDRCENLKEFPEGIRFLLSLKELLVWRKKIQSLKEGGEDFYKVKHIPSVRVTAIFPSLII